MTQTWRNRLMGQLQWLVARLSYGLVNYRHPLRAKVLREVFRCHGQAYSATTPLECAELFQVAVACNKIDGDMAEAGVFLGGTALILLTAAPTKRLHLFDTFEGLPHGEGDFVAGEWKGSVADVKRTLAAEPDRLEFHPGLFPASAAGLEALRFSVVHLDLDLYDSTLAALQWFWPRMVAGGVLLSHDYPLSDGVVKAFDEFFAAQPEPLIALAGNQCIAVKR